MLQPTPPSVLAFYSQKFIEAFKRAAGDDTLIRIPATHIDDTLEDLVATAGHDAGMKYRGIQIRRDIQA